MGMTLERMLPYIVDRYKKIASEDELTNCCNMIKHHAVICLRAGRAFGVNISIDDLKQAGLVGLMVAISKYNPGVRGLRYFAYKHIRGEMLSAIRDQCVTKPFQSESGGWKSREYPREVSIDQKTDGYY